VPAGVLGLVCVFCVLEVPVVLGVPAAGGIPCDPVVLPAGGADACASAQQAMASVVMSSVLLIANFVVISTPRLFCFTFEFMAASTRKNIRCSPELGLKPPRSESLLAARRKGSARARCPPTPASQKRLLGTPASRQPTGPFDSAQGRLPALQSVFPQSVSDSMVVRFTQVERLRRCDRLDPVVRSLHRCWPHRAKASMYVPAGPKPR
jgi:hypothetical protein